MPEPPPKTPSSFSAFFEGFYSASTSVFVVVLLVTYVGFGALAHDFGFSVGWAMLSTALLWAGPGQVILVTALGTSMGLVETAIAVCLSSVRLLPMVVALLPIIKPPEMPARKLILPSHLISISVWIEVARLAPGLPRESRLAFCNGIGAGFIVPSIVATAAGFYLSASLPFLFGAAAMFITPMSFLVSTARNSRLLLERLALAFGLVIGPLLVFYKVGLDLLWTGIIGGSLAYAIHRLRRARQ